MLTLTDDELRELTGYQQPAAQLAYLLQQGFYRARRAPITGRVILERSHYDAVCQGATAPKPEPTLHTPKLRRAA